MATLSHPLMFPLAAMNYLGSLHALKHWSDASHGLKHSRGQTGATPQTFAPQLKKAVAEEAGKRFERWLKGVERYNASPALSRPTLGGKPALQLGAATLLHYGQKPQAAPLLVIPSLINRAYILDMAPRNSMLRFLARSHGAAFLLDWGEPEAESRALSVENYILERLEPAIDHLITTYGTPPVLVGYCMGGLFAVALAALRPEKVSALALLATPWNFHTSENRPSAALLPPKAAWPKTVPHSFIQQWFHLQKPWSVQEKFARFGALNAKSPQAKEFLQIEQWLQDGRNMSGPAAYSCFVEWAEQNQPARGKWRINGQAIHPQHIEKPVFLGIPERDSIVPPAASAPLLVAWPHAHIHRIEAGHVSMIAGLKAREQCWKPLASWLNTL